MISRKCKHSCVSAEKLIYLFKSDCDRFEIGGNTHSGVQKRNKFSRIWGMPVVWTRKDANDAAHGYLGYRHPLVH
jgi:hypothetical protein